jgi:hypothetical protein
MGQNFGSQTTAPTNIHTDCNQLLLSEKNELNFDESSDSFVKVLGHKNILYVKIFDLDVNNVPFLLSEQLTSGEKSKLTNIEAVDFNEGDSRVYLLNNNNGQKQVYSYAYDVGGNNTPIRELISNDAEFATNLRIDTTVDETYLISSTEAWIKVFNKLADPDGRRPANINSTLRNISGGVTTLQAPSDIELKASEIFVLDSDRILVFNKYDNGAVAPKRSIAGANTTLSGSKRLEVNASNEIEVTNGDNSVVKFSITGNGNISPLL